MTVTTLAPGRAPEEVEAAARSVTRPRSPVWNNYLRLAKIVHDEMVKDGAVK